MKPFLLLVLIVSLCSCDIVYFEKPQPLKTKELKFIPDELTGTYAQILNDSTKDQIPDSLIITNDSFQFITHEKKLLETNKTGSLKTGNVVLKIMDDSYILSQKVVDDEGKIFDDIWEINVLKYSDNHLSIYSLTSEDKDSFVDSIHRIVQVKEKKIEDGEVQMINPSKREFKQLLKNNLWKKNIEFEKVK